MINQWIWRTLAFLAIVFILVAIVLKILPNKSSELSEMSGDSNTRKVAVSGGFLPQQPEAQSSNSDTQSDKNTATNETREGREGLGEFIMWLESLDKPVDKLNEDVLDWGTNWPASGRYYARDYLRNVLEDSQWRDTLQTMYSANPDATFEHSNPMDPNSGVMFHAADGTVFPAYQLWHPSGIMILKAEWLFANPIDTNSEVTGAFSDGYDRSHDLGRSEFEDTEEIEEMRDEQLITVTPKKRVTQQQPTGRRGHKPTDDDGESEISPEGKSGLLVPPESENDWHSETGEGSGDSVRAERADESIGMDDKFGPEDGPENSEN